MEKVQKTPSSIQQVGEPDQYGNLAFSIAFNDSTSGFFKCKEQNLFTVGQPSDFYFGTAVGRSGKEYYKIERVEKHENIFDNSSQSVQNTPKSDKNIEQINRSVAIKAACDLYSHTKTDREYVIETAEIFYDYIRLGVVDSSAPLPEKAPPPIVADNVLPF